MAKLDHPHSKHSSNHDCRYNLAQPLGHARHLHAEHGDGHVAVHTTLAAQGVYNADCVLVAAEGYPRASAQTHRSNSKTPQDPADAEEGEPGGESKETETDEANTRTGSLAPDVDKEKDGEEKDKQGIEEDDDTDVEWVSVSQNAYGAFIHVGLQSGFLQAWRKCWTMLIVSIIIAVVFAQELIDRHWFLGERMSDKTSDFWVRERVHICWIPVKLQVAACMIFITLIFNNISGMIEAGRIALQSTHHKFGDGDSVGEMQKLEEDADEARPLSVHYLTRIGIFVCAVLTEVVTWVMILMSGILFIFTSTTVDLVIRSTVAVMFVLNVDEIVFESCCPGSIKEDVEETKYRIVNPKISSAAKEVFKHYFGVYIYLPILVALSVGLISIGRTVLECQQHPIWQAHINVSGVII